MPGIDTPPDPTETAAIESANELIGLLPDPEVLLRWVNRAVGVRAPRLDAVVGGQLTAELLAQQQQQGVGNPSNKPADQLGPIVQIGQLGPLLAAIGVEKNPPCPPRIDPASEDEMTSWAQNAGKADLAGLMAKLQAAIGKAEGLKPTAAVSELQLGRLAAVLQAGLGLTDAQTWRQSGVDPDAFRSAIRALLQALTEGVHGATT
jgi:hypothetical protein